jgi:hypothetical protein
MLKHTISIPEDDGSKVATLYGEDGMGDFPAKYFMTIRHTPTTLPHRKLNSANKTSSNYDQ